MKSQTKDYEARCSSCLFVLQVPSEQCPKCGSKRLVVIPDDMESQVKSKIEESAIEKIPWEKIRKDNRKPDTGNGLFREVTYLYADEEEALIKYSNRERCSKAEVLRRCLRGYLNVYD